MALNYRDLGGDDTERRIQKLKELHEKANLGGGIDAINKQHERRKLTARERIALLVDEDSFQEFGKFVKQEATAVEYLKTLRAVLMASTLAMLGLLPMALSTGVGSETQRPFALVVVGGMLTTLTVALFLLPAIYTFVTPAALKTPEELDA